MKQKIHIGIVDDNPLLVSTIREKLSLIDEIEIVFSAYDGNRALHLLAKYPETDLLLMDIEMPGMGGIEATGIIKSQYPRIKILMLTVFDNDENIFRSILAGADGYLLKEVQYDGLYTSIRDTMKGGAAMTPSIAMKALKLLRDPMTVTDSASESETYGLTEREIEVLEQITKGLSYKFIASNLHISPSTVRKHIENIYRKLQVHSKIEAVEKARRRRLI